jgi:GDP-L-fucose synthase
MNKDSLIFVAGEKTMEGKAILNLFLKKSYNNILNMHQPEPCLTDYIEVKEYFSNNRPQYVFVFAGKSGGIKINQEKPATLMLDNLQILSNVISLAQKYKVKKLLYLASSCTYPKYADQPMNPDMLMTGVLEPTNSAYATAKLAGIELCRAYRKEHGSNFITAIPANIFGPGDDFSLDNSHVMAALMKKMHKVKENGDKIVNIWGTGKPKREFIFVEDLADACLFLMEHYNDIKPINIGSGNTLSIAELATAIKKTVKYQGLLNYEKSKPDGMPEKTINSNKLFSLGWSPSSQFKQSLLDTYKWYLNTHKTKEVF